MFDSIKNIIFQQIDFPFDIDQINVDPEKTFEVQLNEVYDSLQQIYSKDEEIFGYIEKTYERSQYLLKYASLFDFDANTRGNGYWTFLIIMIKLGKVASTPDLENKIGRVPLLHLFQIIEMGSKIGLDLHYEILENAPDRSNLNLFTNHMDFEYLLSVIQSLKVQMNSLHEFFNFCWLGSMSRVMQIFTIFMAIYSTQWKSFKIYNWLSRKTRAKMFTNMVLNVNIDCLKSMWNITESPLVRICWPSFWNQMSITTKNIYSPRQKRWIIDAKKPIVHDLQTETNISYPKMNKKTIRCLLFRYKADTETKSKFLILHVHGGGFISQSPESHACYLINWLKKLKNIPILSIDYTLSPEAVFPEALQEILDVYLWILSKGPKVKNELGFYPEKIALCGDSAGGNFSMALMAILSHIMKKIQNSDENIEKYRYPDGLFLFYAPFILTTMVSPSRILTSIDGLVPLGTLLNCLGAYLPDEIFEDTPDQESRVCENKTQTIVYKLGGLFYEKLKETVNFLLNLRAVNRIKPWYRRTENLNNCLTKMNEFVANPFISPLLLEEIDFNHIPLYLYPLIFDSFLDDSIEMAKRWQKDKVHVEILDEVPHGFLNLIDFDKKAEIASYKCINHIYDILC